MNFLDYFKGEEVAQTAVNTANLGVKIILYGFIVALIAGILFIFLRYLQYQHFFTHVEVVNSRKIRKLDKAREYKDKDGVIWWKTLYTRELAPIPPPEAIEITNKGKKCVTCYRTPSKDFVYSVDTATIHEPPAKLFEKLEGKEREDARNKWFLENPLIKSQQPLTGHHRALLIGHIKKAHARLTKSFAEQFAQTIQIGSIILILFILVFGWGKIMEPALKANSQFVLLSDNLLKIQESMERVERGIQVIKGNDLNMEAEPPD